MATGTPSPEKEEDELDAHCCGVDGYVEDDKETRRPAKLQTREPTNKPMREPTKLPRREPTKL